MNLSIIGIAAALTVASPDGRLVVTTDVTDAGVPVYSVTYDGRTVIEPSPLGFTSNAGDFTRNLTATAYATGTAEKTFDQDRIKQSHVDYRANRLTVRYATPDSMRMSVEWQVSDNDIAFRYQIPRQQGGELGAMIITGETTGYKFPQTTTTFLTPQSDPMIGWKRTKPSYEEFYSIDAPMDSTSQYGRGYTWPALFRIGNDGWVLLSETGVDGYYCGTRLSDYSESDGYHVEYPMPEENNGNGSAHPGIKLPANTPWRTITVGADLAPIIETTIPWCLVEPKYIPVRPAQPGRGTWSWLVWQDASINSADQMKFIDLAAEMGYDHALVDNWWDTNIGRDGMKELADYARVKGVKLAVWYSSSGHWNDIVQGPTGLMDRPIPRKAEMKWLRSLGVNTIKVDFFGGDKQETMRLYEDILSDAADYGIDVIFHGCTLPRGWERMYPNYVGSEAVLASENMIFLQEFRDNEARVATLYPFIRNTVGSMEYGGTILNRILNRENKNGNRRLTGDGFQLATAILYQNPVQNFALTPNNLTDAPRKAIEFMRIVPTEWDETKFIAGYPGSHVVMARRNGDRWFYAGVNALDTPVKVDLASKAGRGAEILIDSPKGLVNKKFDGKPFEIPSKGGFVIID